MEKELKPGKLLKSLLLKEYSDRFRNSSSIFVTDFQGLTNKDIEGLRKVLEPVSADYIVVKNSLCRLALKNLKIDGLADMVDGACALSYGTGDPIVISKALVKFAKDNNKLGLKAAYMDGKVVGVDIIKQLAALPSREVLVARLLGAINSPITGLVMTCSGIVKQLLYALNEIAMNKQETK